VEPIQEDVEGESTRGRGAVLLAGPLYWDDTARAWREARLDMDGAERVHAPVLYCVSERDGACVMSLAPRDSREAGGTAVVVPFREEPDLVAEARALWSAASGEDGIGAKWGTVGALCRPGMWRDGWTQAVRAGRIALPRHRERTPLDAEGLLEMDWPARAGGGGSLDLDAILAVVSVPAASDPAMIGAALLADDFSRAGFYRNRLCGIASFMDNAIIREMRALAV
jgi:hypothetical protein